MTDPNVMGDAEDLERSFRELTDMLPQTVFELDARGRFTYANRRGLELTGYGSDDLRAGIQALDLFVPEDRERVAANMVRVLAGERISPTEYTALRKDGAAIPVLVYSSPILKDGEAVGLRGVAVDITERKRAEQELARSEERFRTLITGLSEGVGICDEHETLLFANPAAERIFGVEPGGLVGQSLSRFVDEENYAEILRQTEVRSRGNRSTYEIEVRRPDGQVRQVSVAGSPMFNSDGVFVGAIAGFRDVTVHVELERRLVESEERYRELVERSGVAILIDDEDRRFSYTNARFLELFGYSAQEMSELGIDDLVHPDDLDRVRGHHDTRLAGGEAPESYRFRGVRSDGKTLHLEVSVHPMNREGRIVGTRSYIWDVADSALLGLELCRHRDSLEELVEERTRELTRTNDMLRSEIAERLKAEEAIRILSRFPSESPDPVLRIASDGRLLYANDAASHLLSSWELMSGELVPEELVRYVDEVRGTGEHRTADVVAGGRTYSFTITPIRGEGYVNLYGRDVTDHRATEERLRHLEKMEAIGNLAGGVAHDFNNLLMAILGHAELARLGLDDDHSVQSNIAEVEQAASLAAQLTRQLLLFGRRQPFETRRMDVNASLANLLRMIDRVIGEDVEVGVNLAADLWSVEADEGGLEQVFMNVALNARDAMPDGGRLTISTRNAELEGVEVGGGEEVLPGRYVCISLEDTGLGMEPDVLERVFEPFFTTKEPGKGTGLGLSVVYGIVIKHGGWVDVSSVPDEGTTFRVYLPASGACPTAEEAQASSLDAFRGAGQRILLVEDDDHVRDLVSTALRSQGYVVDEADCHEQATRIFEGRPEDYELALIDVVLPDRNGVLLAESLLGRRPDLEVILTSGYTDEKSQWRRIRERDYTFLPKPSPLARLLETIHLKIGRTDQSP